MATVNYTCPNCAAPLKFNPDKQMFSCEYCMSDFTEKYVQDFFAKKEQKENSAEKQEKKEQEKIRLPPNSTLTAPKILIRILLSTAL